MKTTVSVATLFASRHAELSPSVAIFFENVVMKAVERAPSAKRSRNIFGTRNAIKNASRFFPAPKSAAKITSRIRPSTRLQRMAMPTTPVARVLTRLFGLAGAVTDATEQRSRNLRKRNQLARSCFGACSGESTADYPPSPGRATSWQARTGRGAGLPSSSV